MPFLLRAQIKEKKKTPKQETICTDTLTQRFLSPGACMARSGDRGGRGPLLACGLLLGTLTAQDSAPSKELSHPNVRGAKAEIVYCHLVHKKMLKWGKAKIRNNYKHISIWSAGQEMQTSREVETLEN